MKKIIIAIVGLFTFSSAYAQVICVPSGNSGSGYPAIENASLGIESPDCIHGEFGAHITQTYDEKLDRNVFVFHSHIAADNDRCQADDRVRMEIKGGPGTDEELQHTQGSESFYRWKFLVDEEFIGASTFNHIFQNKAKGGNDDSFPVLTITLRADRLELRHDGGDTGTDLGVIAQVDIEMVRGKWIEVYCRQLHAENGELEFMLTDVSTGKSILEYVNNSIDLWRTGADYNRPKWGIYRSKNSVLKDETMRFSDFCVSESDAMLCPTEISEVADTVAPTPPMNLVVSNISMNQADLNWDASTDEFGVKEYVVLIDEVPYDSTATTFISISDLLPGTTYAISIIAKDESGNRSAVSNVVTITTDAADAFPDEATILFPDDGADGVSSRSTLQWRTGNNTDSVSVFFGTESPPPYIRTQSASFYEVELQSETTYYWQINAVNKNGETPSKIWTFTTGNESEDDPWQVFRGSSRPEVESSIFTLNRAPDTPPIDEVRNDPNGSTNTFYAFRSNNSEDFRWRHDFMPTDSVVTIVARLKGLDKDVNGICYFEIRGNGWREKIRINQSTIKLEKSTPVEEKELPFDLTEDMHLIRIVSDGQHTTVYFDENPEPFISSISSTTSGNTYFEWGNSGGTDYGAIIDWISIDKTGGYSPSEGTTLPADLFLSSISTLSTLEINGVPLDGFSPDILDYNYETSDEEVPTVTWTTTSNLSEVAINNPASIPDSQATIEVTAQDGFTKTIYTISYNGSTSLKEIETIPTISLSPVPASEKLQVQLAIGQKGWAKIVNVSGKTILSNILIDGRETIDLHSLVEGVYFLSIQLDNQQIVTRKFTKKGN